MNNDDETDNRPSSRREKLKKTSSEDADLEEELQKMSNTYVNDILNGVQRKYACIYMYRNSFKYIDKIFQIF